MATGFTDTEWRVGRLVGLAIEKGVAESDLGIFPGGKRLVGPAAHLTMDGYRVNHTDGIVLGRTYAECHRKLSDMVKEAALLRAAGA